MTTPNQIFSISPEFLYKQWAIGQIIGGCPEDRFPAKQYEIIDFENVSGGDRLRVLLRLLPEDERIKPESLVFTMNANPKSHQPE